MLVPENVSWDSYFMSLAYLASTRSHDKRTKCGAIVVFDNNSCVTGYNGCPSGFNDSLLDSEDKYHVVLHAEDNALMQAGLERCRQQKKLQLFVTFKPCPRCALLLVHYGVKRVVYHSEYKSGTNDDRLLELIRARGYIGTEPVFSLEKYTGNLFFSHSHLGING